MNCPKCGGPLEVRRNATHQYIECGLDNVQLVGIEVRHCPNCGNKAPVLPDLPGLHRVIALAVASKPQALNEQETVFLAKYVGYSNFKPAVTISAAILAGTSMVGGTPPVALAVQDPALRMATFMVIGESTNERMGQLAKQIDAALKGSKSQHARRRIKVRRPDKKAWLIAA